MEVPAQVGLNGAVMVTETGIRGFTVIVMALEVAGFPVAQVALEFSTTVMTSPLAGIDVYVELVAPGMMPALLFHW